MCPSVSAVDFSGHGSLHDWRNVWLVLSQSCHNSQSDSAPTKKVELWSYRSCVDHADAHVGHNLALKGLFFLKGDLERSFGERGVREDLNLLTNEDQA